MHASHPRSLSSGSSAVSLRTPTNESAIDPDTVRLIGAHAFAELFVEIFGWERIHGCRQVQVDGHDFVLRAIAHKRGFQVFHCPTDRYTLINRQRLRAIQKHVASFAHEHVVIYSSEEPRRQVWQWGLRVVDGRRMRHIEHPFFSSSPPPQFSARLRHFQFVLGDEDTVTLMDAVERVRMVLGEVPEFDLFAKRPRYAELSDALAIAMRLGGIEEYQQFVVYHHRLITWFADRWHRQFHIDADDAEQCCAIGVMRAAQRFDPTRGFQFATYAGKAAKRVARRLATYMRFPIHIPSYVLNFCYSTNKIMEQTTVAAGHRAAREAVDAELSKRRPCYRDAWFTFSHILEHHSLSRRSDTSYRRAREVPCSADPPALPLVRHEMAVVLRRLITRLGERDQNVVRLYHGFDGEPMALQAIGELYGVSRERVRQILQDIYSRLRAQLDLDPEDVRDILKV